MAMLARLFFVLLPLLKLFGGLIAQWKARREARKEIAGEIAVKEVKVANEVADIMAQPATPDDAAGKLHDGKF